MFGGRLILPAEQSGTIRYAPFGKGGTLPIVSSGTVVARSFLASDTDQVGTELTLDSSWAANSQFDIWGAWVSSTFVLGTTAWTQAIPGTYSYNKITNNTAITTGTGANGWTRLSNAFDGTVQPNSSVCWNYPSNSGLNNFIGQDFGSGHVVRRVKIYAPTDDGLRGDLTSSLACTVSVSNDNSSWTTLWSGNLNASLTSNASFTIDFANSTSYRYVRFGMTGNTTNAVKVGELEFYTYDYSGDTPEVREDFTYYSGLPVNADEITIQTSGGTEVIDATEATHLGWFSTDAAGQVTCHTSTGRSRMWNLGNRHNQRQRILKVVDLSASGAYGSGYKYTPHYSEPTFGPTNNDATLCASIISGVADHQVDVAYHQTFFINSSGAAAAIWGGVGWNSTSAVSGYWAPDNNFDNTGTQAGATGMARHVADPFEGIAKINMLEMSRANVSGFYGENNQLMTVSFYA